jgi:choline dehydrogenase
MSGDQVGESTNPDLEALYEGVEFVQRILKRGQDKGSIERVELPDLDQFGGDVRRWIQHIAWGHHACGTCRLGFDDLREAVVDSRFRVRGIHGLRIVDASIFPRIPGYFIVANIYMAAEKAADVLTEDHLLSTAQLPKDVSLELTRSPVFRSRTEFEERRFFPDEMESAEAALVHERRARAGL